MKKIIISVLFFHFIIYNAFALQKENDDCLQQLKTIHQQFVIASMPTDLKTLFLEYSIKTTMGRQFGGAVKVSKVNVYANKEKSYLISKDIKIYQDFAASVSVLSMKKTIYINDFKGRESKSHLFKQLSFLQGEMFDTSHVQACDNVEMNAHPYKRIQLGFSKNWEKRLGIEQLTFYLDPDNNDIKKIDARFNPNHKIATIQTEFNAFNQDYKTQLLDASALSQVFGSNGKLLPAYKDYKVIDMRIKH